MGKAMKNCILLAAAMLVAWPTLAATGIWTGRGANNKWVNPENWQDNIVPGKYTDEGGVQRGQTGDTANFGEIAPSAHSTIDLAGLYSIRTVRISDASAPAYVFGSAKSSDQKLTIENGGRVVVDGSNVSTQTITQIGVQQYKTSTDFVELCNNSAVPLVYGDVYQGNGYVYPGALIRSTGTGPTVFYGKVQFDLVSGLQFHSAGEFTYHDTGTAGSTTRYSLIEFGYEGLPECNVNVDNFIYGMGSVWTWTPQFRFLAGKTHIYGSGALSMHYPLNTPDGANNPQVMEIADGATVVCDVPIVTLGSMKTQDLVIQACDGGTGGTIYLNSTNTMTGRLRLFDDVTCCIKRFGKKKCQASESSIPLGAQIIFEGYWTGSYNTSTKQIVGYTADDSHPRTATLKYTGDDAFQANRDIVISNMWSATQQRVSTNTIANAGGGKLTLNTPFKCAVTEKTGFKRTYANVAAIRLKAETDDIEVTTASFQNSVTWHLIIAGPHTVMFGPKIVERYVKGNVVLESGCLQISSAAKNFPYAAKFQFAGGTLQFTEESITPKTIPVEILSGASTLKVGNSVILTVSGIGDGSSIPSGASLNFVTGADSSVKISEKAFWSISLPNSITVNGQPVKVDGNGFLVDRSVRWTSAVDGNWSDAAKWTSLSVPDPNDSVFITAGGSSYMVSSSGTITHTGEITLGNSYENEQATLKGNFVFPDGSGLCLNEGGRWLSYSGDSVWNNATGVISMKGGMIDFSGSAALHVTNRSDGASRDFVIGTGTASFSENSVIDLIGKSDDSTPEIVVRGNQSGETATLKLKDTPRIDVSYDDKRIVAGRGVDGSVGVVDYEITDGNELTSRSGNSISGYAIGDTRGLGIMYIKTGNVKIGYPGFAVGCVGGMRGTTVQDQGLFPTGIVNQTGGVVYAGSYEAAAEACINGCVIGGGPDALASGNGFTGYYNLSGGAFRPHIGLFIVGCGPYSEGYFDMTGGEFEYIPSYQHSGDNGNIDDYSDHPMLVAFGGGKGSFQIGSGSGSTRSLFIGGALATDIGLTGKKNHPDIVYPYAGAKACDGCFSITGGTFEVSMDCYVGADGKGAFEIGGGKFTCGDLVFSNRTESVLRCIPSANGFADWVCDVTGELVITDGAKLEIDVSRVQDMRTKWLKFVSAENIVGEFADSTPVVIRGGASENVFRTFAEGDIQYEHNGEKGVWFRLASSSFTIYFR